MKSNFFKIILVIIFYFVSLNVYSAEEFNFDITEVQILENGNKFLGTKRGIITTSDGITINADQLIL